MAVVVKSLRRHTLFRLVVLPGGSFCLFVFQSVEGRIRGEFLDGKTTATSAGTLTLGIGLDAKRAFHHTGFVINDATLNEMQTVGINDDLTGRTIVMFFYHHVIVRFDLIVQLELVRKAGTTTGVDDDAKEFVGFGV
jgi:hypothetical protein